MIIQFLREPLWFKLLISTTLIISIFFSSSLFVNHPYLQSLAKLAAAVFFCTYGFKMKGSQKNSIIFFSLAFLCIVLSILELKWWWKLLRFWLMAQKISLGFLNNARMLCGCFFHNQALSIRDGLLSAIKYN